MNKLFAVAAVVATVATGIGPAAAQSGQPAYQAEAGDASAQARKAWFERAVGDILTGSDTGTGRVGLGQGRSVHQSRH